MSRFFAFAAVLGLLSLSSVQAGVATTPQPTFTQLNQVVSNLTSNQADIVKIAGCPNRGYGYGRPVYGYGYGYGHPAYNRYRTTTRYRGFGYGTPVYYPRGGYYNSFYRGANFGPGFGYGFPGYRGSGVGLYIGF